MGACKSCGPYGDVDNAPAITSAPPRPVVVEVIETKSERKENRSPSTSEKSPYAQLLRIWSMFVNRKTQKVRRSEFSNSLFRCGVTLNSEREESVLWHIFDENHVEVIYVEDFKRVVPKDLSLTEFIQWCKLIVEEELRRLEIARQAPEAEAETNDAILKLKMEIQKKYSRLSPLQCLRFARMCGNDKNPMKSADTEINKYLEYFFSKEIPDVETYTYSMIWEIIRNQPFVQSAEAFDICKIYIYGRDKYGRPVTYLDLTQSKPFEFTPKESIVLEAIVRTQLYLQNMQEQTSLRRGKTQYRTIFIINMDGMGVMKLKPALRSLMRVLDCLCYLFPDTTAHSFFINATRMAQGIFSLVKGWARESTRSRTYFYGKKFHEAILEHIDVEQLPVEFGGTARKPPVIGKFVDPIASTKVVS